MKSIIRFAVTVVLLCGVVIFSAVPFSCRMTEEGIKVIGGDLTSPKITSWKVTGSDSLELCFSEKVKMKESAIYAVNYVEKKSDSVSPFSSAGYTEIQRNNNFAGVEYSDDGKVAVVKSREELQAGKEYELHGEIEDVAGNTLNFAIPFLGYNFRIPKIVIFAVHPKYSSSKRNGGTVYKNEFVELYAVTSGNLAGLKIVSAVDGEAKSFTLPPLEVKAGTFITAHMRSRGDDCVSETPENLRLCRQEYSSDTSLDLWSSNTESCLGDTADIITLQNTADGAIIDAVAYAPSGNDVWATETLRVAAENAVAAGVWNGSSPKDAACSDDLTPSKMIVRTDGNRLAKDAIKTGGSKNWTTLQVISGSGKKRSSNLGKIVVLDN